MTILNSQAVKFEILSDVKTSEEVFDNLIKVKHCLTGEVGLLLCSHYSRWPVNLIDKADWLAGCFTPEPFCQNNKLVFGNIPKQVIDWQIDKEDKTVVLSIRGKASSLNALGIEIQNVRVPLQYGTKDGWETNPNMVIKVKATKRLLFGPLPNNVDAFTMVKAISLHMNENRPYGINNLDYGVNHIVQILNLTSNIEEAYFIREELKEQAYSHGFELCYS